LLVNKPYKYTNDATTPHTPSTPVLIFLPNT